MSVGPRAKLDGVVLEEFDGGLMVFDTAANRAHRLDEVGEQVLLACDGSRSYDEIVEALHLPREAVIERLADLTNLGLVDLSPDRREPFGTKMSRRAVLRNTAIAGVAAAAGGSAVSALAANGVTSADAVTTSCTNFIQGTTSGGQPTTGSNSVGDVYIDTKYGLMWVCTTSGTNGPVGSPGTAIWTAVGGWDNSARMRGMLACTFDPNVLVTQKQFGTGWLQLQKVFLYQGGTINQIQVDITGAGSGLSNCYLAVYDSQGVLLGVSADQSTAWQSFSSVDNENDWVSLTAQSGQTLTRNGGETLFLAYQANGTSTPRLASPGVIGNSETQNIGLKHNGSADAAWIAFSPNGAGRNGPLPSVIGGSPGWVLSKSNVNQQSEDTVFLAIR
jgi:hypothetical protein